MLLKVGKKKYETDYQTKKKINNTPQSENEKM